jgi:hypothetical protein
MIAKYQSLEWVPYYNPDKDDVPAARKILEDPIAMQNLFPGGIRLPSDHAVAVRELKEKYSHDQGGAESVLKDIERWRALQKLYWDCGWAGDFDGDLFERKRAEFIRRTEAGR